MQKKIKKYLILVCAMGGIVLHGVVWSEMHPARALSRITGKKPVMVQVTSNEEVIQLEYNVPEATFTSLGEESPCPQGTCTKIRVSTGNARSVSQEGKPLLPIIPSIIIIPAGKTIDNIEVTRSGEIEYKGEYFIEFGVKAISDPCTTDCDYRAEPDSSIYYSDNPFPGLTYDLVTTQKKCGVSIVYINLYTATYYPLSERVVSYSSISLTVNLKEAGAQSDYTIACYPERVHPERKGIENPDALESYTPAYCQQVRDGLPTGGICDPAETYEYVVITTSTLKNSTTFSPLSDLTDWRATPMGGLLSVTVVTVDDDVINGVNGIYTEYTGNEDPDDPIDKIRSFIIDAYNNWKTKYVLIIGDPNDNSPNNPNTNCIVPMRYLWGDNTTLQTGRPWKVSSDIYFQCLDGPYNFNEPALGWWGEKTDGAGGGEVDLLAEVFIGRAFVENDREMSNFINKTITYENAVLDDDPYTNNALMVGSTVIGNVHAKRWLEDIRYGSEFKGYKTYGFNSSYNMPLTTQTLYTPDEAWDKYDVIDRFNNYEFAIMNHMGHGTDNNLMELNKNDINDISNNKLSFIYSQACKVGQAYVATVGEDITNFTANAAWGGIFNTHWGLLATIYTSEAASQMMNRQFWDAYFYEGIFNVGAINTDSHEDNLWGIGNIDVRWCYFITTLFGDPYSFFKDPVLCERNIDQITIFLGYQDILARKLITTSADVCIEDGANVTFASGEEIRLGPSLHISNGAEFKAFIDPILYKSSCD